MSTRAYGHLPNPAGAPLVRATSKLRGRLTSLPAMSTRTSITALVNVSHNYEDIYSAILAAPDLGSVISPPCRLTKQNT